MCLHVHVCVCAHTHMQRSMADVFLNYSPPFCVEIRLLTEPEGLRASWGICQRAPGSSCLRLSSAGIRGFVLLAYHMGAGDLNVGPHDLCSKHFIKRATFPSVFVCLWCCFHCFVICLRWGLCYPGWPQFGSSCALSAAVIGVHSHAGLHYLAICPHSVCTPELW